MADLLKVATWQDGKKSTFVSLDGRYSDKYGFMLTGGEHRGYKKNWYKWYYSEYKADLDYWHYIYLLQLHFKERQINFRFTSAYDKHRHIEQSENLGYASPIPTVIDFDNFIYWEKDKGFITFCEENNFPLYNKGHPVTQAHYEFAKYLKSYV